jgi:hypothetical protein
MASSTETGHAKNIANLKKLNEIAGGFGATYNPSNPMLMQLAMVTQQTNADALQNDVNMQRGMFEPFQNARVDLFKTVKPLVRRVRSYAKSCGASVQFFKDVDTFATKILGERVSAATPTEGDPAGTSASQQSFDNTVNNFGALVGVVSGEPLYNPNEVDLKVVALTAKHTQLNIANNKVKQMVVPYNNAVIARNKALYKTSIGVCDVGQASKDYIRGAFGFSSPEFKLVSKITFKKMVKVV